MIARFSPISDQLALSGAIFLAPDQQRLTIQQHSQLQLCLPLYPSLKSPLRVDSSIYELSRHVVYAKFKGRIY